MIPRRRQKLAVFDKLVAEGSQEGNVQMKNFSKNVFDNILEHVRGKINSN